METKKEKKIETMAGRGNWSIIIPTLCYQKYHNEDELYIDVGIAFLRRFYGFNIRVK